MTTHDVTITEKASIATDDGRLVYRARCTCRWIGWAVFERDNARRQRDRHLEQAVVDAEARQWEADHPGGHIEADELAAIDAYGVEACRDEGH